jgi:hypothetical protein
MDKHSIQLDMVQASEPLLLDFNKETTKSCWISCAMYGGFFLLCLAIILLAYFFYH